MEEATKQRLLILVTNSFAAMNIIHSGLIKRLGIKYDVYIMSTMIRTAELAQINKHFNLQLKLIPADFPRESAWLCYLRKIEKALFAYHFNIVTQTIKYQNEGKWKALLIQKLLCILSLLHITKTALCTLKQVIITLSSFSIRLKPLLAYHFKGVISSSPLDLRENQVVNFLGRHHVKSLAMIISWDNLTSKGLINADHNYTLVWNDFMKNEFLHFYSIFKLKPPKVVATGIPRFDCYFQHRSEAYYERARRLFNVKSGKFIILIATSANRHFPNQLEIIEDVLQFARGENNVHVIMRCHPGDDTNAYAHIAREQFVTLWHPENLPAKNHGLFYNWFPELDFLHSLAQMLRICDVCVQFASTMKLDAAACKKPVISIAYDGKIPLPYHQSVQRLYDYAHQVPLNALQIDKVVTNRQQLYNALKTCLQDTDHQEKLAAIAPFTHFTESESVDFTAKIIAEWLD
ncbi:CDP-glycerol glycerophosphotransferase family protein [Dyadobacter sp. CY357]|uniref:CDP-glycerol glycerophosphotransferase family protein n=2 Tax=Dyadobacter chenhuakuii TaxID=2909339 RepID=A0A9X1QFX7_9BACT|nr:CDP-glycerol glycerophosphotransferase family protein [Dyadobacter chenhuakuii]